MMRRDVTSDSAKPPLWLVTRLVFALGGSWLAYLAATRVTHNFSSLPHILINLTVLLLAVLFVLAWVVDILWDIKAMVSNLKK